MVIIQQVRFMMMIMMVTTHNKIVDDNSLIVNEIHDRADNIRFIII